MPLAEVARRFDMTEADVAADLELAAMCGLPPFVDELIDVFIDDGVVVRRRAAAVHPAAAAHRARRLRPRGAGRVPRWSCPAPTRPGRSVAGCEAGGRARRGGARRTTHRRRALDLRSPAADRRARRVHGDGRRAAIDHYSPDRDEVTERRSRRATCSTIAASGTSSPTTSARGERRTFRIDRIESVEPTGEHGEPTEDDVPRPCRVVRRR